MPSKGRRWLELRKLKKLEKWHKQREAKGGSDTGKHLEQAARKRARLEVTQSVAEPITKVQLAGKGSTKKQQKQGTPPKLLMSTSGDRSSERDHGDFSGSGSGGRDRDRGWRTKQREMKKGNSSHRFNHWGPLVNSFDSRQDNGFDMNGTHPDPQSAWSFDSLYTPFDHVWTEPSMPDGRPWDGSHQGGSKDDFNDRGGQDSFAVPFPQGEHQHRNWGMGTKNQFHWSKNSNRSDGDSLSSGGGGTGRAAGKSRWDVADKGDREGSRWNRFARQFQDSHFHREEGPVVDSSVGGASRDRHCTGMDVGGQADCSGLDESTSSDGRKRSHSLEGERLLSKSSRAETSQGVGLSSTITSFSLGSSRSVRAFSALQGGVNQKPDSTSSKTRPHSAGLMPCPATVSTTKPVRPAAKKKQFAESAKSLAAGVCPRYAGGAVPSKTRPGEGVLERAERICRELREKRRQATDKQASLSSDQRDPVHQALDDSIRSMNSTQNSYIQGYLSDSNLPASTAASVTGGSHTSGRAFVASGHLSDVERIRHSIENSVLAEGRVTRPRQVQPAIAASTKHSSPSSSSATQSTTSTATTSNKPPRPQALSKEALARMVNTPQSRTQRVQLARMLRLHATATPARPRHARLNLQLDGLYDGASENSVEDVLKDIGRLEELEGMGELRNVKLEDLCMEDKLRIAQLIEDADNNSTACGNDFDQVVCIDSDSENAVNHDAEKPGVRRCPIKVEFKSEKQAEIPTRSTEDPDIMEISPLASPQRAPSPNPNRPLSLDDLNVTNKSTTPKAKSPTRVPHSPLRPTASASVLDTHHREDTGMEGDDAAPADDVEDMQDDDVLQSDNEQDEEHSTQQPYQAAMESCVHSPLDRILALEAHSSSGVSRQAGVLHEVLGLCQRQDSILAEMRGIDVQLSQLYKSLIEIVARMSSLQRRRMQLQGEGEQLSQQRSSLLAGIIPASHPFTTNSREDVQSAADERQHHPATSATSTHSSATPASTSSILGSENVHLTGGISSTPQNGSIPSQFGSSVTLPAWLNTAPSNKPAAEGIGKSSEGPLVSELTQGSDVCLSGSVSSSVRTAAFQASSVGEESTQNGIQVPGIGFNFQNPGNFPSQFCLSSSVGQPSAKPSSGRESRTMLSLGEVSEDTAGKGSLASGSAWVDVRSLEISDPDRKKDRGPLDTSSGVGSSISTDVSGTSHAQHGRNGTSQSDHNALQLYSDGRSQASVSHAKNPADLGSSIRLLTVAKSSADLFGSPQPSSSVSGRRQSSELSKSSGVSVAYVGSISSDTTSDLVQQIVRSLPLASQLGDVGNPRSMSMYVLKPIGGGSEKRSPSVEDISREMSMSVPADSQSPMSRTRSISLNSGSSDLDLGEGPSGAKSLTVVPRLNFLASSEQGSKGYMPRSESDGGSIASNTSLGEQIKFMSERNGTYSSAASLGFSIPGMDTDVELREVMKGKHHPQNTSIRDCSVILKKLDLDNNLLSEFVKQTDVEKPKKKMKTKKDRDKVVQHRRCYIVESSSDASSEQDDKTLSDLVSGQQQQTFSQAASGFRGQELMDNDKNDSGDQDSTLVQVGQHGSLMNDAFETDENKPVSSSSVDPERLRLNPENLKTFRANVRHNMNTPYASPDSSVEIITDAGKSSGTRANRMPASSLKISGPCAAVVGLQVHSDLLYVCFQQHGVRSYTLCGKEVKNYPLESAQCFAVAPMGKRGQPHLAVGCENGLIFISVKDEKEANSVDTEVKVMCLLVTESRLFTGLDCGAILVVSLSTMQETQRFQASDCAVHCMAFTREGSSRLLCVSDQNSNILVIDAGNGLPVRSLIGHTKTAFALCMMDDVVISGSGDRTVVAHDVHTSVLKWRLEDHKSIVTSVCVDNGLLFSAGYDKIIRCYDLKSRRLLHLMYGAGKGVIMRMIIQNSVLYTGNRDGQVEAVDLRDMGSYTCGCSSCSMTFGIKEHLWLHLVADHLQPNTSSVRCPWLGCSKMLNTGSALTKSGEHMRSHIESM